ncbi:MAG: FtsX-like permease family protein [Planctomycetaceae bacterium]
MLTSVLNGLWHYRRVNAVVMLAVAISTAVIAGSLIVGDSVRFSLKRLTQQRLGQVTHVVRSGRFFRQDLVGEISDDEGWKPAAEVAESATGPAEAVCVPVIQATCSIDRAGTGDELHRAGSVSLTALTPDGWQLLENAGIAPPTDQQVVLGFRTAEELQASPGDEITVWVEIPASIPRDSLLGDREEQTAELVLTVAAVLSESAGASRFDLNPGQQLPHNAFMALETLQQRLGLESLEVSKRQPVARPARVNGMLIGFPSHNPEQGPSLQSEITADQMAGRVTDLSGAIRRHLSVTDLELNLRPVPERGYVTVESDRMILDDETVRAVQEAADSLGLRISPSLVYLSNEIHAADRASKDERYSMYSIVGALDVNEPPPFGPLQLTDGTTATAPGDDDMLLSSWLATDLKVAAGDQVTMTWHQVGSHGDLPEIEHTFTVAGILPESDPITVDRNLTPSVQGVTDVEDFGDIRQPFEMDMQRLTDRDDEYWKLYRATPKAFVSLSTAERLWQSRYGRYTSLRIVPSNGNDQPTEAQLSSIAERLKFEIPRRLNAARAGILVRSVRTEGLQAAVGANDFTQLFLGFSFFLILSAIILASLMFRLGIQQRIRQMGLLAAIGWPEFRIRRLFLAEGLTICLLGAVIGAISGVWFARLMIYGLTTWWVGAVGTQHLLPDIQPLKLFLAIAISVLLSAFVILMSLRTYRRIDLRDQLAGIADSAEAGVRDRGIVSTLINAAGLTSIVLAVVIPFAVIVGLIPGGEAFGGLTWRMVCFFVAGMACLTAGLFLLRGILLRRTHSETLTTENVGVVSLAMANAARNPTRSLLTTALIASAAFVIVAVGAGRRNPVSETPDRNSGNGGFTLVAESAQPILGDLNSAEARRRLGFSEEQSGQLNQITAFGCSMRPDSDASCVNLYQTRMPTILGVPDSLIQRGGFRFADTPGKNPWLRLQEELPPTQIAGAEKTIPTIPVMGDMNTLMFSLKKGIGSVILFPDDANPQYALQVAGMLDGSVFQGVLLMTDSSLKQLDSSVTGSRWFLIETPDQDHEARIAGLLESGLNEYGFDAESVGQRIAGFLAVQNTYLSTFQLLGGLGLLVGTFGLAAVMLRNVVERRREIALMRAVGFTTGRISRLILLENNVLLFWGILLGSTSALLAMLPHLTSTGADLPWLPLAGTLLIVAATGTLAAVFAVRTAGKISVRESLAAE